MIVLIIFSIGGICFELQDMGANSLQDAFQSAPTSYVLLKVSHSSLWHLLSFAPVLTHRQSIPLPLRAMFQSYFELGNRIRKHYLSPSVILCLVSGQFVPPIHRRNLYSLQYSMLPARRAGVSELWKRLNDAEPPTKQTVASMNGFLYPTLPPRRGAANGSVRRGI